MPPGNFTNSSLQCSRHQHMRKKRQRKEPASESEKLSKLNHKFPHECFLRETEKRVGMQWDMPTQGGSTAICYIAVSPRSPVRILTISSIFEMNIFPSPILPVFAFSCMVATALSAMPSATTISSFTLGIKDTSYSAPR